MDFLAVDSGWMFPTPRPPFLRPVGAQLSDLSVGCWPVSPCALRATSSCIWMGAQSFLSSADLSEHARATWPPSCYLSDVG